MYLSCVGLELTFCTSLVCPWNENLVDIDLSKGASQDEPVTDDNKVIMERNGSIL